MYVCKYVCIYHGIHYNIFSSFQVHLPQHPCPQQPPQCSALQNCSLASFSQSLSMPLLSFFHSGPARLPPPIVPHPEVGLIEPPSLASPKAGICSSSSPVSKTVGQVGMCVAGQVSAAGIVDLRMSFFALQLPDWSNSTVEEKLLPSIPQNPSPLRSMSVLILNRSAVLEPYFKLLTGLCLSYRFKFLSSGQHAYSIHSNVVAVITVKPLTRHCWLMWRCLTSKKLKPCLACWMERRLWTTITPVSSHWQSHRT
jgi:hypothetical protein